MKKVIAHKVLPDFNLIIELFRGQFTITDYLDLKFREMNDPQFNPAFNFIGDLRNSEIMANSEDIRKCIAFMKSTSGLVSSRRSAVITATPNQVVISTLFQQFGYELPIHLEIVSTLQGALNWVNCSTKNYEIIDKALTELRSDFIFPHSI